jgi:Fe-S cluster biogenesis protein NfuA
MGELLPTPTVMQPPGSKATDKNLEKALDTTIEKALEPVLCNHCGRTASNGISCEGYCVADSNY